MREIKFRIWDKRDEESVMSYDDGHFYVTAIGEVHCVNDDISIHKDVVLMQYTEFKDVDGKEIYEGDILRIYDEEDNEDFSWVDDVSFLCGGFFSGDEDLVGNIHFRARVIGNIYENPELIQQ